MSIIRKYHMLNDVITHAALYKLSTLKKKTSQYSVSSSHNVCVEYPFCLVLSIFMIESSVLENSTDENIPRIPGC